MCLYRGEFLDVSWCSEKVRRNGRKGENRYLHQLVSRIRTKIDPDQGTEIVGEKKGLAGKEEWGARVDVRTRREKDVTENGGRERAQVSKSFCAGSARRRVGGEEIVVELKGGGALN